MSLSISTLDCICIILFSWTELLNINRAKYQKNVEAYHNRSGGTKPNVFPNYIRSESYMITFEVEEEKWAIFFWEKRETFFHRVAFLKLETVWYFSTQVSAVWKEVSAEIFWWQPSWRPLLGSLPKLNQVGSYSAMISPFCSTKRKTNWMVWALPYQQCVFVNSFGENRFLLQSFLP